jgi:amino acid adenylation domain-containing protein/thioester reductase-like protein
MARAELLAEALRVAGLSPGEIIGIACGRSEGHIIAMLAAWIAGAAFVSLDRNLPLQRREAILRKAHVRHIVDDALVIQRTELPLAPDQERSLAYVCFSSGSTGEPKGIAVGHEGIVPMLHAQIEAFAVHPQARVLWLYNPSFDASISDIGVALLSGATLVIPTRDLMQDVPALFATLTSQAITHLDLPPSLLPHLELASLSALECVVLGGESADVTHVQELARSKRVINVYGPTEGTVCTSLVRCDATWSRPTIGLPLTHLRYRIVSPEAPHIDVDEGELWIAGGGLAHGYIGDAALTQARVVVEEGCRYFRTGDRVRRAENAHGWEILGRIDRQRKIDGKIASPEEVERAIQEAFHVEACVVTTRLEPHRLVAFIPWLSDAPSELALRTRLAMHLPKHMIPWRFVNQALPRNAHGKVDLQALTDVADALYAIPLDASREASHALLQRFAQGPLRPEMTLDALGLSSLDRVELLACLGREGRMVSTAMLEASTVAQIWDAPRASDGASLQDLAREIESLGMRSGSKQIAAPRACTLFTGATGFLGRRWVRALLETTSHSLVCLVRGADAEVARTRLLTCLGTLTSEQSARIEVVCGDVEEDAFGLSAAAYTELTERIDHVVHSAASMSVVASRAGLWNANVLGTARVLRFVHEGAAKSLDYVSTLAVLAATDRPDSVFEESDSASTPCRIYGGYAQTKWCAEQLVRRTASEAPMRIHRLGLLVGNHASSDWLTTSLHGLLEVGAYPDDLDPELAFDVTPVAYAAQACSALREAPSGTFHLRGRTLLFRELVALLKALGVPLARVSREAFRNLLVAHPSTATSTLQLAFERGPAEESGFDLFLATRRSFDMTQTRAALKRLGIPTRDVSDLQINTLLRDILHARAKESRS